MKIFITGASGFIGGALAKFYSAHDVYCFHRNENISERLSYFKPDTIINSAAEIYDAEKMWDSNVLLTKSCLDYQKDNPDVSMIQIGSSSEYGSVTRPTMETDPVNPTDMYSGTKGIASLLCQTYGLVYKSDVIIMRPYSPYGPGEKPHRLFPNLWRSFKLNKPMNLVNGVHDFCYIDDFVRAVDIVLTSSRRKAGEILNVSNGCQYTNYEVLKIFQKVTGKEGNVQLIDKFVTQPIWQCDNTIIKIRYGWLPQYNLEQGIAKFLEQAHYE